MSALSWPLPLAVSVLGCRLRELTVIGKRVSIGSRIKHISLSSSSPISLHLSHFVSCNLASALSYFTYSDAKVYFWSAISRCSPPLCPLSLSLPSLSDPHASFRFPGSEHGSRDDIWSANGRSRPTSKRGASSSATLGASDAERAPAATGGRSGWSSDSEKLQQQRGRTKHTRVC